MPPSTALDDALAAITPAAPANPAATKEHRTHYRLCVCVLADGLSLTPDAQAQLGEAVVLMGVGPDDLRADVAAMQEAFKLNVIAGQRDSLNQQSRDLHDQMEQFERDTVRRRAELLDRRNELLGQVQVASNAVAKFGRLEADNPRLAS